MSGRDVTKKSADKQVRDRTKSALRKYQEFFVGSAGMGDLLRYELARFFASPCPGALGYVLRKRFFPGLFARCGEGAQFGKDLVVRHPAKIAIGDGFAIDDGCLLDARGAEEGGLTFGDDVLVSRGCCIAARTDEGTIEVGSGCVIGRDCILASTGGIEIGASVAIGSQSYIGGGRYRTDRADVPIIDQGLYTEGPVFIGEGSWIGAHVTILDGVSIGRGAIIGSGAVVHEDVPEYTVAVSQGHRRLETWPRELEHEGPVAEPSV